MVAVKELHQCSDFSMIEIKVKSIWQGKVGVRDKYVEEALKDNEGLAIKHEGKVMTIPNEKIAGLVVGKSEQPFKDRFYPYTPHYLIYFLWKPDPLPPSLFD